MKTIFIEYPAISGHVRTYTSNKWFEEISRTRLMNIVKTRLDLLDDNEDAATNGKVDVTVYDEDSAKIVEQFSFWYRAL